MKYYKLINDNEFIGVISSSDFLTYIASRNRFLHSNEILGEYVSYNGQLYRSTWMHETKNDVPQFTTVTILEISEDEYNTFQTAIENNETIAPQEPSPIPTIDPGLDTDALSIDFLRDLKLQEISAICRTTIENGLDVEVRGELHHFSLDTQDQLNLISLNAMAQTQELIPYHADGEACIFYTAEEITNIVAQATAFKIYHTTYHNALKAYVNSLNTVEAIRAVEYGMPIPEEFQTDVLKAITK